MICYLNGSPKASGSMSGHLIDYMRSLSEVESTVISSQKAEETSYEILCSADVVVLVFPLYVDALPSHLLRFLIGLENYRAETGQQTIPLYAAAQCGFYEGTQNRHALAILEHYCRRAGFLWRGGIGLGGAPALQGSPKRFGKPLYDTVIQLQEAVLAGRPLGENRYANIGLPRRAYLLAGNLGWILQARTNSLKRGALYLKRKPG